MNNLGQSLIQRKVKTGNPSHETNCEGYVYTMEPRGGGGGGQSVTDNRDVISKEEQSNVSNHKSMENIENEYEKIVAICSVPPEQVPGGVLNFARSYRSHIRHVRVLISDEEDESEICPQSSLFATSTSYQRKTKYSFMDTAMGTSASEDEAMGRGSRSSRLYLVLVLLSTKQAADSIVKNLNGKPFNSFEKNIVAHVYHVGKIEGNCGNIIGDYDSVHDHDSYTSPLFFSRKSSILVGTSLTLQNLLLNQQPLPPQQQLPQQQLPQPQYVGNKLEVNNCPVCLEPMDIFDVTTCSSQHSDAIFTTVCNHTFHMHCLLQWEDAPCPVCRFDHAGLNETLSECHVCGSTERVYVCLICGVASCSSIRSGRGSEEQKYNNSKIPMAKGTMSGSLDHTVLPCGHAKQHYDETLHAYAVDTETQHVWDFVGQGFVHRLIQNFEDGKIVEVADPTNTTSQERSLVPGLTDAEEEEVVHRKLEECANEYNNLLKGQLEQQRLYFQGLLLQITRDHHEIKSKNRQKGDTQSSSTLIAALKQDLHQLQQRYHSLEVKHKKIAENISFLKNMNESLEANKEPMQKEMKILQQARISYNEMIKKELATLEDHVAKLMLKLE